MAKTLVIVSFALLIISGLLWTNAQAHKAATHRAALIEELLR